MLGESVKRTYLNVSLGKLRIKCEATNPKAVERIDSENKTVHELVYQYAQGILEDIRFKSDDEYGNKWLVYLKDGAENYVLQFSENSRYCGDFLCKLPKLKKGNIYKFTPWEIQKDNKHRSGVSIKDDTDIKITSYYQKYPDGVEGAKPENINGFPSYQGDWKDKDETKIYFLQVTKFLRTKALEYLSSGFAVENVKANHSSTDDSAPMEPVEDLPF
jgi:hypothetical protein